jgi:hypothetical protein
MGLGAPARPDDGAEYRINPSILRRTAFKGTTSLRRIEDHRLRELILQDLGTYEDASRSEIHSRIGPQIVIGKLRRVLKMKSLRACWLPRARDGAGATY